jgi:hypothetical protein
MAHPDFGWRGGRDARKAKGYRFFQSLLCVPWPSWPYRVRSVRPISWKTPSFGSWTFMDTFRIFLVVVTVVLPLKTVVFAQSLADVARQEEERRKAIKKPSKVYTTEDLRRDSSGSTPTTVSAPAAPTSASTPSSSSTPSPATTGSTSSAGAEPNGKPPAESSSPGAKDQASWKGRITQARDQLERSKTLADAMQSRINALNTDFVNTDDPAKRSGVERDRQKALAELERLKREIKEATKGITDIEEEARRANVPPGWLR